ncbi:MAG: histidine phosphatase family protein [Chitinophagaceae bacterium]
MSTKIIIARHGNTFHKEEKPRRLGITDIPLVEENRAKSIGKYLLKNNFIPTVVYAAPLQRTMQTALLAIQQMNQDISIISDSQFSEINYGIDENKIEEEVVQRIGENALQQWNEKAIVPQGWEVDPLQIINIWIDFSKYIENTYTNKNVLIVSSNGIIRFAPYITGNFEEFTKHHNIKVGTGHIAIFEKELGDTFWQCLFWNKKIH